MWWRYIILERSLYIQHNGNVVHQFPQWQSVSYWDCHYVNTFWIVYFTFQEDSQPPILVHDLIIIVYVTSRQLNHVTDWLWRHNKHKSSQCSQNEGWTFRSCCEAVLTTYTNAVGIYQSISTDFTRFSPEEPYRISNELVIRLSIQTGTNQIIKVWLSHRQNIRTGT